jgi:hypothetical protein
MTVKGTIREEERPPLGHSFHRGVRRFALRLIWVLGWVQMFLTFGWVGHLMVTFTSRLLEEKDDG